LIQATAADINKENWGIIEEQLGDDGHLILNTHDSYSMSIREDWEPVYERVKTEIERPNRLKVPMVLDLSGAGDNWWEASSGEEN
jgi:DNA polymerase I-like protein with 3'-5' exonuclease and polymerase domains